MLAGLPQLAELSLFNNELSPDGVAALAPGLSSLRRLRTLNLGCTLMGRSAAPVLAGVLRRMWELREVRAYARPSAAPFPPPLPPKHCATPAVPASPRKHARTQE